MKRFTILMMTLLLLTLTGSLNSAFCGTDQSKTSGSEVSGEPEYEDLMIQDNESEYEDGNGEYVEENTEENLPVDKKLNDATEEINPDEDLVDDKDV